MIDGRKREILGWIRERSWGNYLCLYNGIVWASCCLDHSWRESWAHWEVHWNFQPLSIWALSGSVCPAGWGTVLTSVSQTLMQIQISWDHVKMQVLIQCLEWDVRWRSSNKHLNDNALRGKGVKTQNPILEHINCENLGFSLLISETEIKYYVGLLWALNDMMA